MLRSNWCLAILAAGLVLLTGLSVTQAAGRKKPRRGTVVTPVQTRQTGDVVDGYGPNDREARARALENAQRRVAELLQQEAGDPDWRVPEHVLAPRVLEQYHVIAQEGKVERDPNVRVDGDETWVARYKVQLTDEYLRAVQQQARQERVLDRHLLLARLLGGVLAVLLVSAGYLRLEELTRGYATQLLRLAAFALLALAGLAIWLTMP